MDGWMDRLIFIVAFWLNLPHDKVYNTHNNDKQNSKNNHQVRKENQRQAGTKSSLWDKKQ